MSINNISVNPVLTTNAQGSFNVTSAGYIQGQALDDPSARNTLAGGTLSSAETIPMWGGCGISLALPGGASRPHSSQGPIITRATSLSQTALGGLNGFSVFNQAHSMISSAQSPVPSSLSGMGVNFHRLGSGVRIVVACDADLASLVDGTENAQVSWDFAQQRLIPYSVAYPAATVTNAVWASTSGGRITFTVGTDLTTYIDAGDDITISGIVQTGAVGLGLNGTFKVVSITSTTIVVTAAASATVGTYVSGGGVVAGGGALPVKILDLNIANSMTVSYDPTTGQITWNRLGSAAVILI